MQILTREMMEQYTLLDNEFMTAFFQGNIICAQLLLREVTGISDLIVIESVTQFVYKNFGGGKGIRLDIKCEDADGRRFDVEVENSTEGLNPRRNRLYAGVMDAAYDKPGKYGESLPDTYIIYICANDPFDEGLGEYVVEKTVQQTGRIVDDGLTEIYLYVDGEQRTQKLTDIMHDFKCSNPHDMRVDEFKSEMVRMKQTKEGERKMSETLTRIIDEISTKVREESLEEGVTFGDNRTLRIANILIRQGRTADLERAEHDERFRQELYNELNLKGDL